MAHIYKYICKKIQIKFKQCIKSEIRISIIIHKGKKVTTFKMVKAELYIVNAFTDLFADAVIKYFFQACIFSL